MTPKELHYIHEGYLWRRDDRGTMLSSFTAALLAPHTKRKIKPTDLYKPVIDQKHGRQPSKEDRKKKFEEAVKSMGPDVVPVMEQVPKIKG